jgi:hypothetical protein
LSIVHSVSLAGNTLSKKNRCFSLFFFASFRISSHWFCSKRALAGDAPAATALGVGPGEQGGSPETHLGDGSGGRGVCLGSRAVRPRLCVGAPPCRKTGSHFENFRVCWGLSQSQCPVGRFGSPLNPPSPWGLGGRFLPPLRPDIFILPPPPLPPPGWKREGAERRCIKLCCIAAVPGATIILQCCYYAL